MHTQIAVLRESVKEKSTFISSLEARCKTLSDELSAFKTTLKQQQERMDEATAAKEQVDFLLIYVLFIGINILL